MMQELKAMMNQRIMEMETYKEQADFIETVYDTLTMTGQLTEGLESVINNQWDRINKEFMERNINRAGFMVAV